MKKYYYQGRNQQKNKLQGMIEAESKSHAASKLLSMGISPYHIDLGQEKKIGKHLFYRWFVVRKISHASMSLFFSQLYSIARSNIPIVDGLRSIAITHTDKHFSSVLKNIIFNLESGFSITDAFYNYRHVFGGYAISLIAIGEKTSNISYAFAQIKNNYEEEIKTRRQMWQALRYPMIVMLFIIMAIFIVNWFVVPSFQRFFSAFSAELPWPTQFLMQSSYFFTHYSHVLFIIFLFGFISISYATSTRAGRLCLDRSKFQMPIVGRILSKIWVRRFCDQLSHALSAQVPILSAIQTISAVSGNLFFSDELDKVRVRIERGESFSLALKESALFEPLIIQMVVVGEQTGTLADALQEVATYYQKEIEYQVGELSSRMEPILISIVAGFVLLLALGVFLPMWDISSVALGKY